MGCRPSRRAVTCVRAAGEGSWGIGRAARPRGIGDGGVRLRPRSSSRRNGDRERNEGGGGNPRDRYSAPPTDRQFPPHSCTSATYQYGCCGTSRITLRLSKNGSTLEIEKCDIDHSFKSCQHCGQVEPAAARNESRRVDVLLRTQSAPNLSTVPRDSCSYPPPIPPRHLHAVDSEPHPPPLPPRDFGGFGRQAHGIESEDPRPGSVDTATKVDIDVQSLCSYQPSSFDPVMHGNVNIFAERDTMLSNEYTVVAPDRVEIHPYHPNEHYALRNGPLSARAENFPSGDAQNVNIWSLRPYDKRVDETTKAAQQEPSKTSLPNHHISTGAVDLTSFYSSNADMFSEDFDVDCPSGQSWCLLGRAQDETGDTAYQGMEQARAEHFIGGKRCHGDGAVTSVAASVAAPVLRPDGDKSAMANGASECCHGNRVFTHGATDYRIRMLGAWGDGVISHVADTRGADDNFMSAGVRHTCIQMTTGAIGSRLTVGASASASGSLTLGVNDSRVKSGAYDSPVRLSASGVSCHQMTASVNNNQTTVSSAGVMGALSKLDHHSGDESTDTGCESDEEGDRSKLLARLEMAPAYVHADFKNDFGDLFDDSSPGFETS